MKSKSNYKTFITIKFQKLIIVVLNDINKTIYKNETIISDNLDIFDDGLLDNFINQNIFKIEKEINEFIQNIFLILEHSKIHPVKLSIKNKVDDILLDSAPVNNLLLEAKNSCEKTLEKNKIIHIKIDQFYIDDKNFKILPEQKRCKNLSIDLSFICLPNNIFINLEKILNKYQISIKKIFSYDYLNSSLKNKGDSLYLLAEKSFNGFNENEVLLKGKTPKNRGFFEKFFDFFN